MARDESASEIMDNYTKNMETKFKKGTMQALVWVVATVAVYFIWGTTWFFWVLFAFSLVLVVALVFLKVALSKFTNTLSDVDSMRDRLSEMTSSFESYDESDEEVEYTEAQKVLEKLLNALEEIGEEHGEIYDTACREQMREVIHQSFIFQKSEYVIPSNVGLFSEEGNALVVKALNRYLIAIAPLTEETKSPKERLEIFQDDGVYSEEGQSMDEFFGWVEVEDLKG